VNKLLEKRAEDRFPSAREVVNALEAELNYLQNPGALIEPKRDWLGDARVEIDCEATQPSLALSPLMRFSLSVLLVLLVFLSGWSLVERNQRMTKNGPVVDNAQAEASTESRNTKKVVQIEFVPLWNSDGYREFSERCEQAAQKDATVAPALSDSWRYEVEVLRRNMAKFEAGSF
jgi:hypothetical protein